MNKTLQLSDFPDFIQKGFKGEVEEVTLDQVKDRISNNFEKGLISEELYCESMDLLEKGGKRATVGEIREFGGRKYIKTGSGWKFYGKGTGSKAASHADSNKTESFKQINGDHVFGEKWRKKSKEEIETEIKRVEQTLKENPNDIGKINSNLKFKLNYLKELIKQPLSSKEQKTIDEVIRRNAKNIAYAAGISEKEFNGLHDVTKRQLYQDMKKRNSKKDFYAYVNEKFGTAFGDGDIEEFEDEDMRRQLTDEDIKAIVDAEKEELQGKQKPVTKIQSWSEIDQVKEKIEGLKNQRRNLLPTVGKEIRNEIRNQIIDEEKRLKELKEKNSKRH